MEESAIERLQAKSPDRGIAPNLRGRLPRDDVDSAGQPFAVPSPSDMPSADCALPRPAIHPCRPASHGLLYCLTVSSFGHILSGVRKRSPHVPDMTHQHCPISAPVATRHDLCSPRL